jgi:hypothetical protein
MRYFSNAVAAVAAVLFVASLSAQAKPDFAGKWTLVPDPAAAADAGGGGGRGGGRGGGGGGQLCGQECTITSDGTSLTFTRTTQAGEQKAVYKLDGSDSKNMQQGRGGATEVVSKAMWDGAKVAISTTRDFGGNSVTTKATLSVAGGELTIVNEGQGQAGPTTTTQKYKKG